jgi:hypothetical protein
MARALPKGESVSRGWGTHCSKRAGVAPSVEVCLLKTNLNDECAEPDNQPPERGIFTPVRNQRVSEVLAAGRA